MRRHGRGIVLVVIVAMLTPALADADDLGGLRPGTITVASPGDLPVVPTIIMADCFCPPDRSINKEPPQYVGSGTWDANNAWRRSKGVLYPPTVGESNRLALYDAGRTDLAVEATLVRTDPASRLGLVVRSDGERAPSTSVRLVAYLEDREVLLVAVLGGTKQTIANEMGVAPPTTTRLRGEVVEDAVRVLADGVTLIDTMLPADVHKTLAGLTFVGLFSELARNERVDDMLVTTWPL